MRTDNSTSIDNSLAVSTSVLMKMLNCGKPTAIRIGTEAGAKIVIGRKILWNPRIVQRYLDDISE